MSETILFPSGPRQPVADAPSRGHAVVHMHRLAISAWLPWVLAAAVILAIVAWSQLPSAPDPSDAVHIGRGFAPRLAGALADGFEAEARALDEGKTVTEADTALKQTFHDARAKAFAEFASPAFNAVVPSGSEPKDDATRAAFAKLHREFAKGLRGGVR